ncbi:hypothetical protein DFQ30_001263, partial [Apophysomyces sp. BC1015]
ASRLDYGGMASGYMVWRCNDAGVRMLRKYGDRYQERHIVETRKFGVGSAIVWGYFWAGGLGPLVVMDGT